MKLHLITKIQLKPEARAFAETAAKPPFLFKLGPEKGRAALDEIQLGPLHVLPINIVDLTIKAGRKGIHHENRTAPARKA